MNKASAAIEALAGNTIIRDKRWWHLGETTVSLTPQQLAHFENRAREAFSDRGISVSRIEISGIDLSGRCRCDRSAPQVRLLGYLDSPIVGFQPVLKAKNYGCSRCGTV